MRSPRRPAVPPSPAGAVPARRGPAAADRPARGRRARRSALAAAAMAGSATAVSAVAVAGAAAYFARRVVTPELDERHDLEVLGVGAGTVTLRADEVSLSPGRYGMWQDARATHARFGEVVDHDVLAGTVTRRLLAVDAGRLSAGGARLNQYFWSGTPGGALGLPFTEVDVPSALGPMPAWHVPPSPAVAARATWAVLVHGRGATREECLRAVPVFHRLGFPCLVVSYRNDQGAPRSGGGRYRLGDAEWADVEAAIIHAATLGAKDVVLGGWSMGGAIALQVLARSWTVDRVLAAVLDSPVLDWRDVLHHHARMTRLPQPLGRMSVAVLEHSQARRLAGLEEPVVLDRLDWVTRAADLQLPILLIHGEEDGTVPAGPSEAVAAARPDLVTYLPVAGAGHTRAWNVDPEAWEAALARFLLRL